MNSEQDETTVVQNSQPKDFESAERDAVRAYHDYQDQQDAAEHDTEDSRDYKRNDQEAADAFLRAFGLPDSAETRKRAQEAAEGQDKKVQIDMAWVISEDGTPSVRILNDIPAQEYLIDDIEQFSARLTDTITTARRMAAMWEWLTKNGVEDGLRKQLVLDAVKITTEKASKDALMGMTFGGMFRSWS